MSNFKFYFLPRDQLESLSLGNFFLAVVKILPCYDVKLVTLFLPFSIVRMFNRNHLNYFVLEHHVRVSVIFCHQNVGEVFRECWSNIEQGMNTLFMALYFHYNVLIMICFYAQSWDRKC